MAFPIGQCIEETHQLVLNYIIYQVELGLDYKI